MNGLFSSAVIGLGQIGMGYDFESVLKKSPYYTHCKTLFDHSGFDLLAGVDLNEENRSKFEKKFSRKTFSSVQELYKNFEKIDVIAIAVPTALHLKAVKEIIQFSNLKPKIIVLEKPIAPTLEEAIEIQNLCKENNIQILVNFIRRFDIGTQILKQKINDLTLGEVQKVQFWYSKGIINNGSHFIDLSIYLFGEVLSSKLLNFEIDRKISEPSPDFVLSFKNNLSIYFLSAQEENFSFTEMSAVTNKGLISYREGGKVIEFIPAKNSVDFKNYIYLDREHLENIETNLINYQWNVYQNIYEYLTKGHPLFCTDRDGIQSLEVITKLLN